MKRNKTNRPSREPRKGQQTNAAHQKQHRQKMEDLTKQSQRVAEIMAWAVEKVRENNEKK